MEVELRTRPPGFGPSPVIYSGVESSGLGSIKPPWGDSTIYSEVTVLPPQSPTCGDLDFLRRADLLTSPPWQRDTCPTLRIEFSARSLPQALSRLFEAPYYRGSCQKVACPELSTGDYVVEGCQCVAGLTGSVKPSQEAPFYVQDCEVRDSGVSLKGSVGVGGTGLDPNLER